MTDMPAERLTRCIDCGAALPEAADAQYCPACGGWQAFESSLEDASSRLGMHITKAVWFWRGGLIVIACLTLVTLAVVPLRSTVERWVPGVPLVALWVVLGSAATWIVFYFWVTRMRRVFACPACGDGLPLRGGWGRALAFCLHCGTRLLPGHGRRLTQRFETEDPPPADCCSFCGTSAETDDQYCRRCGAHIGPVSVCPGFSLLQRLGRRRAIRFSALLAGNVLGYGCLLPGFILLACGAWWVLTMYLAALGVRSAVVWAFGAVVVGAFYFVGRYVWRVYWNLRDSREVIRCAGCTFDLAAYCRGQVVPRYCPACGLEQRPSEDGDGLMSSIPVRRLGEWPESAPPADPDSP